MKVYDEMTPDQKLFVMQAVSNAVTHGMEQAVEMTRTKSTDTTKYFKQAIKDTNKDLGL